MLTIARRRRISDSAFSPLGLLGWLLCVMLVLTDQWLLGPSLFVLLLALHVFMREEGPPVVPAAFTYQWLQVTLALFYFAVSGRRVADLTSIDPTRMVLMGLASIIALFGGYFAVNRMRRRSNTDARLPESTAAPLNLIVITYGVAVLVNFPLQRIAWSFPAVTQLLIMLSFARYCVLFILMTRLLRPSPRWTLVLCVVAVELLLGFTGYFATFKESLVFIVLAIMGSANRRGVGTWIAGAALASVAIGAAVTWTAIKPILREEYKDSASAGERLYNVARVLGPALKSTATGWEVQVDRLVSRIWMIRYPALAIERVPSVVPHEDGRLLWGAVSNTIMPRMFFPDKGVLPSSSDNVRKYSGVYVAGRETRTSYAFGYVAESYVDFGWPWMLVPILVFGSLIGCIDWLIRSVLRNSDLRDGVRVVVLWSTMYAFEVSWVILIGMTFGLVVVLVGGGVLFESAFLRADEKVVTGRRPPRPPWRRRKELPSHLRDPKSTAAALPRASRP